MVVAWTYLFHAYYRREKVEYRYFEQRQKRKRFQYTKHGAVKCWELERCLDDKRSPLDKHTSNNLRFLIGLRHEIEHQMTLRLDEYLTGRYQACCLNYNAYVKKLFGDKFGIDRHLGYSLQFADLSHPQVASLTMNGNLPQNVKAYIAEFDGQLTHDEFNSPQYSYRLLFKQKLVGKPGQADRVVEFIDPSSDIAKQIDKQYWVQKEVERPKYLPGQIVKIMKDEGFSKFNMHHHTLLWKTKDSKKEGKGFGTEVASAWYWYDRWIDEVRKHCEENRDTYR